MSVFFSFVPGLFPSTTSNYFKNFIGRLGIGVYFHNQFQTSILTTSHHMPLFPTLGLQCVFLSKFIFRAVVNVVSNFKHFLTPPLPLLNQQMSAFFFNLQQMSANKKIKILNFIQQFETDIWTYLSLILVSWESHRCQLIILFLELYFLKILVKIINGQNCLLGISQNRESSFFVLLLLTVLNVIKSEDHHQQRSISLTPSCSK